MVTDMLSAAQKETLARSIRIYKSSSYSKVRLSEYMQRTIQKLSEGGYISYELTYNGEERRVLPSQRDTHIEIAKNEIERNWKSAYQSLRIAMESEAQYNNKCYVLTEKGIAEGSKLI